MAASKAALRLLAVSAALALLASAAAQVGVEGDASAALAGDDECRAEGDCALNAMQLRGVLAPEPESSLPNTQNANAPADSGFLEGLGLGDWSVEVENATSLSELESLLDGLPPPRIDESLLDGAAVPEEPAPWSNASEALDEPQSDIDSLEAAPQLGSVGTTNRHSCAKYGCVAYKKFHACQCNYHCSRHGDCCSDFHAKCSASGGGKIVVKKAWVALLDGHDGDKKFPQMLCNIVKHITKGAICHNGLLFEGSVAGRWGYYFLEYGNSGFVDMLTGTKHFGLAITPARERFQGHTVLARRIHTDLSHLSSVVEQIRDVHYCIALNALIRLQHRKNRHGFSKHPWCSDFMARILVGIGCLRNDAAAWNAQPTDFSSHAVSHQLHFTCGVEPDMRWNSNVR